jgi:D-tagatose-bisphosphate aldolase class II non-catalytic subunit
LAKVAEAAAGEGLAPVYIIGTEVPVPGGAQHALEGLAVTRPEAALRTVEVHRRAFKEAGLEAAFARAIGVVVQPGVEFASSDVIPYEREKARVLTAALSKLPGFTFEAHSTDYQSAACLKALVEDGFAILKVGPWLTFALREALYGLDCIANVLSPTPRAERLLAAMEALMLREPDNWRKYYDGDADQLKVQRHFSFSDRIRYYWPHPEAQAAVERLFARLGDDRIPEPLISQYLGKLSSEVTEGSLSPKPRDLVMGAIQQVLRQYESACAAG